MRKYDPLCDYLSKADKDNISLTFTEIEDIISDDLPHSARNHRAWWANGGHSQSHAWLNAGYSVIVVDFALERVIFEKLMNMPHITEGREKK